jgi:hypothetical protein
VPFPGALSVLIRDPFVRRAFERAEREEGTAPAIAAQQLRKPLQGGAKARRKARHACLEKERVLAHESLATTGSDGEARLRAIGGHRAAPTPSLALRRQRTLSNCGLLRPSTMPPRAPSRPCWRLEREAAAGFRDECSFVDLGESGNWDAVMRGAQETEQELRRRGLGARPADGMGEKIAPLFVQLA